MSGEFVEQKARIEKYIQKTFSEAERRQMLQYDIKMDELGALGREARRNTSETLDLVYRYGMAKGIRYERARQRESDG